MKKQKKLKSLTNWDWTVLPAAWRYYEHRMTIASSMFPGEIVQRFFSGEYDADSCRRIAHQFYSTDHGLCGEEDWTNDKFSMGCDKEAWCKFFAFCKAWCEGYRTVVLDGKNNGKHIHDEPLCFYCEYTKKWYSRDQYIANPFVEQYCGPEFIKEIK